MSDKLEIIKDILNYSEVLSGRRFLARHEIVESLMQVPIEILVKRRNEVRILTKEQYSVLVLPDIKLTFLKLSAMTTNLN